jgi:hypothetical protein
MRTTVELAPDLMRLAKSRSAERGESLKTLLNRAVAAELGHAATGNRPRPRMVLPVFGGPKGPPVRLDNSTVAQHLADADAGTVQARPSSRVKSRRRRDASRR